MVTKKERKKAEIKALKKFEKAIHLCWNDYAYYKHYMWITYGIAV